MSEQLDSRDKRAKNQAKRLRLSEAQKHGKQRRKGYTNSSRREAVWKQKAKASRDGEREAESKSTCTPKRRAQYAGFAGEAEIEAQERRQNEQGETLRGLGRWLGGRGRGG